jgi:hypothetical protein
MIDSFFIIIVIHFIDNCIFIYYYPPRLDEVRLAEYIYTHEFIVVFFLTTDIDFDLKDYE